MLAANLALLRDRLPNVELTVLSPQPDFSSAYHSIPTHESAYALYHQQVIRLLKGLKKRLLGSQPKLAGEIYHIGVAGIIFLSLLTLFAYSWLIFCALLYRTTGLYLDSQSKRFLKLIAESDAIYSTGGGYLNDESVCLHPGLYTLLVTYWIAKQFGKKVILVGQTIGPFRKRWRGWLAGRILNKVDLITLRDRGFSASQLKQCGVNDPLIYETTDDAFNLPPEPADDVKKLLQNLGIPLGKRRLLGISAHNWSTPYLVETKQILAKIADNVIETYGASVLFVPMAYADRAALRDVAGQMRNQDHVYFIAPEEKIAAIQTAIGFADVFVGTRSHAILFATKMGVPSVGVCLDDGYYLTKMREILTMMGIPENLFRVKDDRYTQLQSIVNSCFTSPQAIRAKLKAAWCELESQRYLSVDVAVKLLEE